jgi:hydroxyacylglutathione hydrolase
MEGEPNLRLSQDPNVVNACLEVSPFFENTYVFGRKDEGKCLIIDPGDDPENVLRTAKFHGLGVECILLTHGHLDHVIGCQRIRERIGCKVGIHRLDEEMFVNSSRQGVVLGYPASDQDSPDFYLEDGDELELAGFNIKILHTPGHTPGSVCLHTGDILFSGDLLFAGSIGRTDLPGGSYEKLIKSVVNKVFTLDDNTLVFPGHGPRTTVGFEKKHNPFFI